MPDRAVAPNPPRQQTDRIAALGVLLNTILSVFGVTAFAVTLLATLGGVFARYFGLRHFEWTFEIAGIAFLWTTFLGVVIAEVRGENVAFSVLAEKVRGIPRRILVVVTHVALVILAAYMLWSGFAALARSGSVPTPVLRWPSAVSICSILVFAAAIIVVAVIHGLKALRGEPRRSEPQP